MDGEPTRAPPRWLSADGPLGTPPERQVLVAGGGLAGVAAAGALRRAGHDPLRVGPVPDRDRGPAPVWPPTLRFCDAVGAGSRLRARGRPVTGAAVVRRGVDGAVPDPTGRALLVGRADLRAALAAALPAGRAAPGRRVDRVTPDGDAVAVTFADGVRERFDVVVDARPVRRRADDATGPAGETATALAHRWTTVPGGDDAGRVREVWTPRGLVQAVPRVDGPGVAVLTTAPGGGAAPDGPRSRGGRAAQAAPDGPADRRRWADGRVVRVGPAAFPVAPAGGLGPALAVADARALAEELVGGPRPVLAALGRYATDRAETVTALTRAGTAAADARGWPLPAAGTALGTATRLRAAALASLWSDGPGEGPAGFGWR